jgi:hypothetical protein
MRCDRARKQKRSVPQPRKPRACCFFFARDLGCDAVAIRRLATQVNGCATTFQVSSTSQKTVPQFCLQTMASEGGSGSGKNFFKK